MGESVTTDYCAFSNSNYLHIFLVIYFALIYLVHNSIGLLYLHTQVLCTTLYHTENV